ncbi:MAG: UDP-N-acetylmuramate--L-alanine ligase [Ginsengibacter sp.]|jgi:UDP-N-acetylmuramate--alanine ligase
MNDYSKISRVYFLGIGGIGMSALARYFLNKKIIVSGYDKTPSTLTAELEKEGAHIHYTDDIQLLDKQAELIIYTPAIPNGHKEFNWYKNEDYKILKRSDVLYALTQSSFSICIAGTHGKTTTSTMIAHILRNSGFGCSAFLGGISVNYHTNYWSNSNNVVVVEADEYDRSFLKLSPDIALISSMDADHLDIYGTVENMREAFAQFAAEVKEGGLLLTKFGILDKNLIASNHLRYSLSNETADSYAINILMKNGGYEFDVVGKDWVIENMKLNIGGMHNVENVVAAITIAKYLKIDDDKIRNAVAEFKGVKRRFEYIINSEEAKTLRNNVVYIDDYAHHPEELKALIKSAKALFNKRKCTIIFQPHLYSRTRDFAKEFAAALDLADEIILLPIYPARELSIEGVSSEMIVRLMENKNASVLSKELVLKYLRSTYLQTVSESVNGQMLLTAGAGNIDQMIQPIKRIIESDDF